jgi:hypothetical protein
LLFSLSIDFRMVRIFVFEAESEFEALMRIKASDPEGSGRTWPKDEGDRSVESKDQDGDSMYSV